MKPFIGIKKIWYGDVFTEAVTKASLKTWLESATQVKNSHQDTWQYTEDDPTYTDYINELSGNIYYRDVTQKGAKPLHSQWVNIHLTIRLICKVAKRLIRMRAGRHQILREL